MRVIALSTLLLVVVSLSAATVVQDDSKACMVCKTYLGYAKHELDLGLKTVEQMAHALENLCHGNDECEKFLSNVEENCNQLRTGVTVEQICENVGVCAEPKTSELEISALAIDKCSICETVGSVVKYEVDNGAKTLHDIIEITNDICKAAGGPVGPWVEEQCRKLTDNAERMVDMIHKNVTSHDMCVAIGMCEHEDLEPALDETDIDKCTICEKVVALVKYEVKLGTKTTQDIIELVNDLCADIGGPLVAKECHLFTDRITTIIQYINDGLDNEKICEKLGLCQPSHATII